MPFTALLVDDEPLAREGLRALISQDPEIAAIHEAVDGRDALAAIRNLAPDLVFLDVQMPEMSGFDVLERLGARMPIVVFVTAHDEYAIDAFEINAVDYLLKPVTRERFASALVRAKARLQARPAEELNRRMLSLLETVASPRRFLKRIVVRSGGKATFVAVDDVRWIKAAENYVQLNVGHRAYLLHVTMSKLERSLDPEVFQRIHRSIIINVRHVKELQPVLHGEYLVTLSDGVRLQSSRTYHERLKALAANPF